MVKNMKSNLKAWLGAFALLLMVSVAALTFAFKADVKEGVEEKKVIASQQWYSIAPVASNANPSMQNITATIAPPPATSFTDCAITGNAANFCAVLLEFPGAAPTLNSGTVQNAIDTHSATIVSTVGTGGYSRLPF